MDRDRLVSEYAQKIATEIDDIRKDASKDWLARELSDFADDLLSNRAITRNPSGIVHVGTVSGGTYCGLSTWSVGKMLMADSPDRITELNCHGCLDAIARLLS